MRRALAIVLSMVLLLAKAVPGTAQESNSVMEGITFVQEDGYIWNEYEQRKAESLVSINDPQTLSYIETEVYRALSQTLGEEYMVESVKAEFVSGEYLEEVAYNSRMNIFYGYSLEMIEEQFQEEKYVFTLGESGETIVVPFTEAADVYDEAVKNVLIGTGMILIYATITTVAAGVTGGAGTSLGVMFMMSASSGIKKAASVGLAKGVICGVVRGYQTGDIEEAIETGVSEGSKGYLNSAVKESKYAKWSVLAGKAAIKSQDIIAQKNAASGGLTMTEAGELMNETSLPANFLRQIHSMSEYRELEHQASEEGLSMQDLSDMCMTSGYPLEIVKQFVNREIFGILYNLIGLCADKVDDRWFLVQEIDTDYEVEENGTSETNLDRMKMGEAPINRETGEEYQLHFIGKDTDSPVAILTGQEHHSASNDEVLHDETIADGRDVQSLLSDSDRDALEEELWKSIALLFE